jgi:hypothetical protein
MFHSLELQGPTLTYKNWITSILLKIDFNAVVNARVSNKDEKLKEGCDNYESDNPVHNQSPFLPSLVSLRISAFYFFKE